MDPIIKPSRPTPAFIWAPLLSSPNVAMRGGGDAEEVVTMTGFLGTEGSNVDVDLVVLMTHIHAASSNRRDVIFCMGYPVFKCSYGPPLEDSVLPSRRSTYQSAIQWRIRTNSQESLAQRIQCHIETYLHNIAVARATAWGLGDAVRLCFADCNDVGGANTPVSTAGVPQPGPSEKAPSPAPPLCSGSASAADRDDEETYVRPPLLSKREAFYEDFLQTRVHQILQSPSQPSFVDPFGNFEEDSNQQLGGPSSHTAPATGSGTRDSLAALYRSPFVFMFQGPFEQEAAGGCKFHLNQTVLGATRSVDFSSEATLDQAGVANSMLSMTWN